MAIGNQTRGAPRGPAATRRNRDRAKTDRDGDLKMDIGVKGRASRGGISKSTPQPSNKGDLMSRTSTRSGGRGALASGSARGAILRRAAAAGDISMNDTRAPQSGRGGLAEIKVTGWSKSKASDSADGGASALITWIEKKASNRLGSRARSVKVKKVCYSQHPADCRPRPPAAISGPPSFAANTRTTTAIQVLGQRSPDG